jgi:hypothetical protein
MTDIELGWAAGFYEGEGYCRSRKGGGGLEINVGQNDRRPLNKLRRLFGGSVTLDRWRCERVKRLKLNHNSKFFYWRIGGHAARKFLEAVYPFVASQHKQKQINEALAVPLVVRRWSRNPERLAAMREAVKHMDRSKKYGDEIKNIAEQFGVSPKTIYNIRERYIGG